MRLRHCLLPPSRRWHPSDAFEASGGLLEPNTLGEALMEGFVQGKDSAYPKSSSKKFWRDAQERRSASAR